MVVIGHQVLPETTGSSVPGAAVLLVSENVAEVVVPVPPPVLPVVPWLPANRYTIFQFFLANEIGEDRSIDHY